MKLVDQSIDLTKETATVVFPPMVSMIFFMLGKATTKDWHLIILNSGRNNGPSDEKFKNSVQVGRHPLQTDQWASSTYEKFNKFLIAEAE